MPDPNLESEARREAERQIGQSAMASGILKTAADNGRANVRAVGGAGIREVVIATRTNDQPANRSVIVSADPRSIRGTSRWSLTEVPTLAKEQRQELATRR